MSPIIPYGSSIRLACKEVSTGTSCGVEVPGGPVVCHDPLTDALAAIPPVIPTLANSDPQLEGQSTSLSDLSSGQSEQESGGSSNGTLGAAQTTLDLAGMIPGPVGIVANVASAVISAYNGHYGQAALSLAFAIPIVGQVGEVANGGFKTFRAFKRVYGAAEEGMQWHHIVGQTTANVERFGPEMIHNIENIIQVPTKLHIGEDSISAYYSSKRAFTNGLTVREWLKPQSFEAQRDFGLQVLRDFGILQ